MPQSPSARVPDDVVTLRGGRPMPLLGFGTWQIRGREATVATATALEAGYRHVDTATLYGNEAEVGRALRDSGLAREDVFVTTKCPPSRAGQELATLRESLDLLGTAYVDLWLVHWPAEDGRTVDMWRAFVQAREAGLARDIGVSNFSIGQVDEVSAATGVEPAVNQVEWSPLLFDQEVLREHRERDVALEGYSGLRGGVLGRAEVLDIAERHGCTTAQVVIRWHLQHGVIAIPKSRDPERIRSNADVADLELAPEEMARLDALAHG